MKVINIIFTLIIASVVIYTILKKENRKKKFNISNNVYIALVILISIIAIGTRIYKFGEYPNIHVDEAGMGYDAYCLAHYSVDRYLNRYPVYLINYNSGQSALYAYLAAILIKFLGFNLKIIRLPSLILSFLAIIITYRLVKEYKGKSFALCIAFMLAICPWHIMQSRWGLDCNLMSTMMIISIYSLMKCKKNINYIISGILFGITLYTYALSYIIVPLFLFIVLIKLVLNRQIKIKNIISFAIPFIILALPLFLTVLKNSGILENINLPFITIPKLISYRGQEISIINVYINLMEDNIFRKLFMYDNMAYNAIENFGPLYYFSLPLLLYGFLIATEEENKKQEKITLNFMMIINFLCVLIVMLIIYDPNINKANAIYIPSVYFICIALQKIFKKNDLLFYVIIILFIITLVLFYDNYINKIIVSNSNIYTVGYNSFLKVVEYVEDDDRLKEKDKIIDSDMWYSYYLVANPISPYKFQEKAQKESSGKIVGYFYQYEIIENIEQIDDKKVYILSKKENIDKLLECEFKIDKIIKNYVVMTK